MTVLVTAFLRAVSFKRIRWVVLDLDSCVLLFFLAIAEYGSLRVVGVVVAGPLLGFMLTAGVFGTGFLVLFFLLYVGGIYLLLYYLASTD